jgi:hypothetical protein
VPKRRLHLHALLVSFFSIARNLKQSKSWSGRHARFELLRVANATLYALGSAGDGTCRLDSALHSSHLRKPQSLTLGVTLHGRHSSTATVGAPSHRPKICARTLARWLASWSSYQREARPILRQTSNRPRRCA